MFDVHIHENVKPALMNQIENTGSLKGRLRYDEPMSGHTSWRVGGPADRFYVPSDIQDLTRFVSLIDANEPITWIGLGSNLLVRDGGIRGTVIATKNMDDEIHIVDEGKVKAGAGIACAQLAKYCTRSGLYGAEFLIGIPGTLGGALAMNAGAFGSETWDVVDSVLTIDRRGRIQTRVKEDFSIAYRTVKKPDDEWFISATLRLEKDTDSAGNKKMKVLLNQRSASQPIGQPSCGSVFRNPDKGEAAAKLIDDSGLKGTSIGGASVSDKHANFIINTGSATAADIENLILLIQARVYEKFGTRLEPEVRIVGENGKRE